MSPTQPTNPYLLEGWRRTPSDMHVQSGYPIWTLESVWYARGQSDEAVIKEYDLHPAEWAAAKEYYFAHQQAIDARRILNDEPGDLIPGSILLEDLLRSLPEDED